MIQDVRWDGGIDGELILEEKLESLRIDRPGGEAAQSVAERSSSRPASRSRKPVRPSRERAAPSNSAEAPESARNRIKG